MYALKVLSGGNAGQVYPLAKNEMLIGRSNQCEIAIPNKNISKQHAKVILDKNRILFTDLNSTNGSFVNGIKVEVTLIKEGDKISLYDTILELVETNEPVMLPGDDGEEGMGIQYSSPIEKGLYKADRYLEKSAMPPLYILSEKVDYKWIIGILLFTCVVATALLSTIPLMNIIQDTVELESKRRSVSLAKSLALTNRTPLQNNRLSAASVESAYQEPGVRKAYIIKQSNGEIVSPSIFSGQFPKNPYLHEARKITDRPYHVFKADSKTIIAMHPIKFYSAVDSAEVTKYYSVVIYDAKILSVGSEKTLSLFVETLFLSVLFGLVIFFFMYKMVEFPIKKAVKDLRNALRDGNETELKTSILFSPLQELYVICSSLLNRVEDGSDASVHNVEVDRSLEVKSLVEMLGYPSIIISNDEEIVLEYNPLFEDLTGLYDIQGIRLYELTDQALQQNLSDLIERSRMTPDQIVTNDFEFSGVPYEVRMHPIQGSNGISYFVCSFFEVEAD